MQDSLFRNMVVSLFVSAFLLVIDSTGLCGSLSDSIVQAKQEAATNAYTSFTTHDEIVAEAKKEGKVRLLGSLSPSTYKALITAFRKRYAFVTDVYVEEITGPDAYQRFLLELRAGKATGWDIFDIAPDFWTEYLPYVKRFDILGMASRKVLTIPPAMIDPQRRTIVSTASSIFGIGYNRRLIAEEKVPRSWEDFLGPEFKGKKFMVDIRPLGFAALAAGLGEKWTIDYAGKIAAQDPVWVRGQSRSFASMIAGEHGLLHLAYYHSCLRAKKKDPGGLLECRLIEPVPGRLQEFGAISHTASNPHTGLLWLEFLASSEGQAIIDSYEPFNTSIYASDSAMARTTSGKKLSVNGWDTVHNTSKWEQMVSKAFGFPRVEEGKRQ